MKALPELGVILGEVDATAAGRFTGQAVVVLAVLAGILKCWSISRRPTTNRKCVSSLLLVLLAFLVSCSSTFLSQGLGTPPALAPVIGLLGFVMLGLVVTAIILAILGLNEYSRQPGAFTQGRGQAIWSLVLGGLICAGAGYGFLSTVLRGTNLLPNTSTTAARRQRFEELNFEFQSPDRPWVALNASKINKDSKLSFMRRFPEVYFMIIAENLGMPDFTCEQLAELGKTHLQAASQTCKVIRESPLRIHGIDGLLVETEASVRGLSFYYQHWYVVTNGYAYQLIGYGRNQDRQRIQDELRPLFSRFSLIDPSRLASNTGGAFTTNVVSARYGYTVAVANSGWHASAAFDKEFPEAEFAATKGGTSLAIVPVPLAGNELSADALAAGLLSTMGIQYGDEKLTYRRPLTLGDLQGVQYDFVRSINKATYHYRLGLLQTNGNAFLVTAWTVRPGEEATGPLTEAMARVSFHFASFKLLSTTPEATPQERKTQGLVLNQAGLFYFRAGDYGKALPLFRAAARAHPEEKLYLVNTLQAWRHLDRPKEALDYLTAQPAAVLEVPETRAWLAYFQAEASLTDQALTNYAALFATGYRNDGQFSQFLELLKMEHRYDTALEQAGKYLGEEDSIPVRLLQAQLYRAKKDFTNALAVLKQEREKAPFNHQITEELIETCLEDGLYKEALDLSRDLINASSESPFAFHLKGRSELGLKWYREAKASFESALKLAPTNKEIKSYLDYVSGLLGEGSNSDIKEPIEMVVGPSVLTNSPTGAPPGEDATRYGAYYTRWVTAVHWEPGKDYRTSDSMFVHVLDQAGVAAFSTVQVAFNPLGEQVFVNEVSVKDASGKTISTGKVADYYLLDDPSSQLASQKKVLNIPIPGLQPGCDLTVTITRRELGRLQEFPFVTHTFSRGFPVQESVFVLSGNTGGLKYRTSAGQEPSKIKDGLLWRVQNPMVARREPLQARGATYLPMLWIGDAGASWSTLASNYLANIQDRMVTDDNLAEKARQLVKGATAEDAKIAVLTRYVQTNLVYKAIEFGRRAQIPNKPADVLRNRYGDCKDHAVLLQQMLKAVGVPAQLGLVNVPEPVQQDLPSLDQFDHMIVFVPDKAQGRFLDCTDKGADVAIGLPLGLRAQEVFILDPSNPRFATIPPCPEHASGYQVQRRLRYVEPGDLAVDETIALSGAHASYLRAALLHMPASSRRTIVQRQLHLELADISQFEIAGLETTETPLQLHYVYTLKKQFHRSNGRLSTVLHLSIEKPLLEADPVERRLSPFELRFPFSGRSVVSIEIPPGFRPEPPSNTLPQLDPRFAECQAKSKVENNRIVFQFDCQQRAGEFSAADYSAYRETMGQVTSVLEREVGFVPVGL